MGWNRSIDCIAINKGRGQRRCAIEERKTARVKLGAVNSGLLTTLNAPPFWYEILKANSLDNKPLMGSGRE